MNINKALSITVIASLSLLITTTIQFVAVSYDLHTIQKQLKDCQQPVVNQYHITVLPDTKEDQGSSTTPIDYITSIKRINPPVDKLSPNSAVEPHQDNFVVDSGTNMFRACMAECKDWAATSSRESKFVKCAEHCISI